MVPLNIIFSDLSNNNPSPKYQCKGDVYKTFILNIKILNSRK